MKKPEASRPPPPAPTDYQPCLRCDEELPAGAWKTVEPDHLQGRCPACRLLMDLWVGRYLRDE